MTDEELGVMFERGWTLYLSADAADRARGLAVLTSALAEAERAAGVPEGDRSLRSAPPSALTHTYLAGDRVIVATPFITILAEPHSGRLERVVRGLHSPESIRGTTLFVEQVGAAKTRIIDGATLAPVIEWERTGIWQSPDGSLIAAAVMDGESKLVVFDTLERRTLVAIPIRDLDAQVRFVDDGRVLVIGKRAHDARSGRLLFSSARELGSPAFTSAHVAFVAADGTVTLADRNTWKRITKTRACAATGALAFDTAGKELAIGGEDTACVVDVPSLRVRRTHAGRRLPIFQHPELEARLVNRIIPKFVGNDRVLALTSTQTSEVSLFDTVTGRELFHDVGELFEPPRDDAYVVTGKEPRELVTIESTGAVPRRPMPKDEYLRHWRTWAGVPVPEVQDRIRTQLCFLYWGSRDFGRGLKDGWWVVPREACDR